MKLCLSDGRAIADPAHAIAVNDRGLNYGDGVFETMFLRDGRVRFLDAHLQRLQTSCERLGIALALADVEADVASICSQAADGVLKIVVTRGSGGRGYRPDQGMRSHRILTVHDLPAREPRAELAVRWCDVRMSRNAMLAGMKHLNRLEQVLAQNEWHDARIGEGLMLDTEGELVSGTASNVFIVRGGTLLTPDLRFCGVRGVMRAQVLRAARELGLSCGEEPLWPEDLHEASEVFLTNSVRGIRSVTTLGDQRWTTTDTARQIAGALQL